MEYSNWVKERLLEHKEKLVRENENYGRDIINVKSYMFSMYLKYAIEKNKKEILKIDNELGKRD